MLKYCKGCEKWKGRRQGAKYEDWYKLHEAFCSKNHSGSSGKMEVDGMVHILSRSKQERNVIYSEYIGDGDSKTFNAISEAQPYGNEIKVQKIECVGHIQKRMGSQLRNLKKNMVRQKLSDGKGLCGKGRLTDRDINELTVFFGNAIRGNRDSLVNMKLAIWAIFHHKRATDENPSHDFCPKGKESWCGYQKAIADGTGNNFKHINSLPVAVMDCIKNVFKNLSSPSLLRRCLGGKTQNNNESINSLIWKFCPKTSGCGRKIAEISVNEAVVAFNEGRMGRLKIMGALELPISQHSIKASKLADVERVKTAEKRCQAATLNVRRAKRLRKLAIIEREKKKEGIYYEPGYF